MICAGRQNFTRGVGVDCCHGILLLSTDEQFAATAFMNELRKMKIPMKKRTVFLHRTPPPTPPHLFLLGRFSRDQLERMAMRPTSAWS